MAERAPLVSIAGQQAELPPGDPLGRSLSLLIAQDSFEEIVRSGGVVTDVIHWTDAGKTVKLREESFTRSGGAVTTITQKQYDKAGALAKTLTGTIARTGGNVDSITWVES